MGSSGKPAEIIKLTNQNNQEIAASSLPITIRVKSVTLDDNNFRFDDVSKPRLPGGIDYAHLDVKGLTLHADDFIFSIERQWKENDPYYKVTSSNHSYFNDMGMPKLLKSVDKVDEYTVKIVLNQPE